MVAMNPSGPSGVLNRSDNQLTSPQDINITDRQLSILRKLKEALRCSICCDLQDDPSYFSACGHSFCGVCLAKSFLKINACPECGIPVQPCDAIRFHAMGGVVSAYLRFNFFCERSSGAPNHSEIAPKVDTLNLDDDVVDIPRMLYPMIKESGEACTAGEELPKASGTINRLSTMTTAETTINPSSAMHTNSALDHAESMIILAGETCVETVEESLPSLGQHLRSPERKAGKLALDSLNPDGSPVNVPASPRSCESQGINRLVHGEGLVIDNTCEEDLFYSVAEQESSRGDILSASEAELVSRSRAFATDIENTLNCNKGQLWMTRESEFSLKRTLDQLEEAPGWRCKLI